MQEYKIMNFKFLSQFPIVYACQKKKQGFKIDEVLLLWFYADIYLSCLNRNLLYMATGTFKVERNGIQYFFLNKKPKI